jgi:ATP phosphoribosyltransferase
VIRLALPDGHQQRHVINLFEKTGIVLDGYEQGSPKTKPSISIDGIGVTVIRPQDMPTQVAVGNFDIAFTGVDWLFDHKFKFPKSPVEGLLDLGVGLVRVVAVVKDEVPAASIDELNGLISKGYFPRPFFRIASEYINIADYFGMKSRIESYRIIPTYGATEALLPEDADMIIENTETGTTLKKNKLMIVDELFVSVGCIIGRLGIGNEKNAAVARLLEEFSRIEGVEKHKAISISIK